MVHGVIANFRAALQQRGGWKGLREHMYTNGDYPFKVGTLMGTDAAGNRYYENRVDFLFGQHRWVEPGDIHNFDSSSIPPEWHGWMTSMNDTTPTAEPTYVENAKKNIKPLCHSDAPFDHAIGHQEKYASFHHMHNQSTIRSRGYNIGNPIVGLPPGAPDSYYTQPGSPYNEASRTKLTFVGDLDEGKPDTVPHRKYKSEKWAERLRTKEEKDAIERAHADAQANMIKEASANAKRSRMMRNLGAGTLI